MCVPDLRVHKWQGVTVLMWVQEVGWGEGDLFWKISLVFFVWVSHERI